ncbi:MAG: aminopeptidase, partial [Lachnospiraceae bacterium]|nr:aminopeptidase [Lachnospiraceae bacterium]
SKPAPGKGWLQEPEEEAADFVHESQGAFDAGYLELGGSVQTDLVYGIDGLICKEVFLQVYGAFLAAAEDNGKLPPDKEIKGILYSFISDYADYTVGRRIREQLDPSYDFALRLVMDSDFSDLSYLDGYGEYVDEGIRRTAAYINSLPEEKIHRMADAFTEGFRLGFINTGKDLSKKRTVNIRYHLGFERVVRAAVENFRKMGLKATIYRRGLHAAVRNGMNLVGYSGARVNRQMDFDHREDNALFLDKAFMDRKLFVTEEVYEEMAVLAGEFAGPALLDIFGEDPFLPKECREAYHLSPSQQKLSVKLAAQTGSLVNRYIRGDERSFTIISFPVPDIGDKFEQIFDATVDLNTLDYDRYKEMQQRLIETLERGSRVEVKGRNGNRTNITVSLMKRKNPEKETVFENCLADVNIPVGEVFTSPSLPGTDGVLHVSEVYLNGLRFENLEFHFKDGFVTDYSCTNFQSEEENRKYIKDHILHHYESLPIGEFAVGTNTTAYRMAKDYQIFSRLEILIAEKTGPHFALGDTCYSRSEDIRVYNPDGREIVSRDNEHTEKRRTDPDFQYYECHTDITIPYDELDSIVSIDGEGNRYPVIEQGRYVVAGTEELNLPLD